MVLRLLAFHSGENERESAGEAQPPVPHNPRSTSPAWVGWIRGEAVRLLAKPHGPLGSTLLLEHLKPYTAAESLSSSILSLRSREM